MTGLNGVHALLAFLTQQAQASKPPHGMKTDVKQLEALLQESRQLNERLLKIERLLSIPRMLDTTALEADLNGVSKAEGNWPASNLVRDVINSQERQQAFGYAQVEKASAADDEPYFYRETLDDRQQMEAAIKQVLIQRYTPTESEETYSKAGMNFGLHREVPDFISSSETDTSGESGRLLLMSIGFSLLLLMLFAVIS